MKFNRTRRYRIISVGSPPIRARQAGSGFSGDNPSLEPAITRVGDPDSGAVRVRATRVLRAQETCPAGADSKTHAGRSWHRQRSVAEQWNHTIETTCETADNGNADLLLCRGQQIHFVITINEYMLY